MIDLNTKLSLNIERNKPYPGNFRCNDELLTNIWYTGVYTQEISTGGTSTIIDSKYRQFIDGGKRDRALWSADTWVQLLVSLVSNYDIEGAKNTLESFANKQYSDGYIPHMIPVDGEEEKIALKLANELVLVNINAGLL